MTDSIWNEAREVDFSNWIVINRGRSPATARLYVRAARGFFSWVKDGGHEINPDGVRAWLRHLYFQHGCMENSTRAGRLSGLRTVCRWMVATGVLTKNPTDGVEAPTFRQHAARKFDTATLINSTLSHSNFHPTAE